VEDAIGNFRDYQTAAKVRHFKILLKNNNKTKNINNCDSFMRLVGEGCTWLSAKTNKSALEFKLNEHGQIYSSCDLDQKYIYFILSDGLFSKSSILFNAFLTNITIRFPSP